MLRSAPLIVVMTLHAASFAATGPDLGALLAPGADGRTVVALASQARDQPAALLRQIDVALREDQRFVANAAARDLAYLTAVKTLDTSTEATRADALLNDLLVRGALDGLASRYARVACLDRLAFAPKETDTEALGRLAPLVATVDDFEIVRAYFYVAMWAGVRDEAAVAGAERIIRADATLPPDVLRRVRFERQTDSASLGEPTLARMAFGALVSMGMLERAIALSEASGYTASYRDLSEAAMEYFETIRANAKRPIRVDGSLRELFRLMDRKYAGDVAHLTRVRVHMLLQAGLDSGLPDADKEEMCRIAERLASQTTDLPERKALISHIVDQWRSRLKVNRP